MRKLHIKQIKNDKNGYYIMVLDRTIVRAGVPLITFTGDNMNDNMQDALDYCKALQRVSSRMLVWN